MEQKWSDWFNRLEALLLAKTIDRPQETTFSAVKVTPTHAPLANVIRTEPFLKPSDQPSFQQPHRPSTATLPDADPSSSATASKAGSDTYEPAHRLGTSGVTLLPVIQNQKV